MPKLPSEDGEPENARRLYIMKEITFDTQPAAASPEPTSSGSETHTIGEALMSVVREPSLLVRNWNYKGAILSGTLRAPIFLITYLIGRESIKLALGAALAQFVFRFLFAGLGGALIQGFRRVEPAWKALLAILLIVPLISHIIEFLVQIGFARLTQTAEHTDEAIIRSVSISILSALFSLFIMRRNVMIVGEAESKSIFSDIARIPILLFEFMAFVPLEIAKMIRRGAYFSVLLSFVAFAIFSQVMCWAIVNKPYWTYNKGKWTIFSFWAVDGLILLFICIGFALIHLNQKEKHAKSV